jgi:pimeloyl-ACP methyl ester carboxylesterase
MKPVALELSKSFGVLEPLQTKSTIDGQVEELKEVLESNATLPVTLVGYSWGAWLSFIFAAKYPLMVSKLILVSSGPFEDKYARGMMETRLSRLSADERCEALELLEVLNGQKQSDKNALARFGQLMSKTDSFKPMPDDTEGEADQAIYLGVWPQARQMRKSGELLALGAKITCPVVAIHGDYDPHPAEGVREPLSRVLSDFRFILLNNCGHKPWAEEARINLLQILYLEATQD